MGAAAGNFMGALMGQLQPTIDRREADKQAQKQNMRDILLKGMQTDPAQNDGESDTDYANRKQAYHQQILDEYNKTLSHPHARELVQKAGQALGLYHKMGAPQGGGPLAAPAASSAATPIDTTPTDAAPGVAAGVPAQPTVNRLAAPPTPGMNVNAGGFETGAGAPKAVGPTGSAAPLGAAPNTAAPAPSPVAALPSPVTPRPVASVPFNYGKQQVINNQAPVVAQQLEMRKRRQMADAAGLKPGTAAYNEVLLTGAPGPVVARQAQVESDRAEIDQRIQNLKDEIDPSTKKSVWEGLTPRQQAEVRIGAKQVTPELRPQNVPGQISNTEILRTDPNAAINGVPLDPSGFSRIQVGPQGPIYYPANHNLRTGYGNKGQAIQYDPMIPGDAEAKGVVSAAFLPTTRTGMVWKTQQNPDGSTSLVQVPENSVSQKGAGGPAANPQAARPVPPPTLPTAPSTPKQNLPPASQTLPPAPSSSGFRTVPFGGKPLPEASKEKMDAQYTAFGNTMQIMSRVKQNLPVLNNLLSAGKIELAMSPSGEAQVISRASDLTPQEAQMASDMMSLAEHINTLRGPLGATGFRGPEAFGALQAQRGSVLGNPKVTADIIDTTLQSMQGQRDAIGRSFKQHKLELPPEPQAQASPDQAQTVKIKVKRKADGVTGTISEKNFDSKKYERVKE